MEKHGIHLDEVLDIESESTVVALGKCLGDIVTIEYDVCQVFAKHDSDLIIMAHGNSFVMLDIFDNAKVSIFAYDNAKVCINRYGGEITESKKENSIIKVIEKNKKKY